MEPLRLGPYQLNKPLGRGGMGTVYDAVHVEKGERAAVKILLPSLATDSSFRERFEAEVNSLRKLRHPNIVALYGYGEDDGHLFYAMELVDGEDLQSELNARRRFTWQEVTQLSIDVCRALKHAHDHGIIHRDLKPANLLLTQDEQVKLSDFGIAKLFGASHLTSAGGVLGTADYMSPEQADGEMPTPRCDLYSLGSVMFTLLASRPPIVAKSMADVVHKLRYEKPLPVGRFADDVPQPLEKLIEELLEKKPEHRTPTALAVANRLTQLQQSMIVQPLTDSPAASDSRLEGGFDTVSAQPGSIAEDVANRPTMEMNVDDLQNDRDAQKSAVVPEIQFRDVSTTDTSPSPVSPSRANPSQFTAIDHQEEWKRQLGNDDDGSAAWIGWAMLLGLLAVLAFVSWRVSRPPTADQSYDQLMHALGPDMNLQKILENEPEIRAFVRRFPDDGRVVGMEKLLGKADLNRKQRRFERRARENGLTDGLSPVEQMYLEALLIANTDPDRSVQLLRVLPDVYSDDKATPKTRTCLALAKSRLEEFQLQLKSQRSAHAKILEDRLEMAKGLVPVDVEKASRILEGILTIYHQKPWAEKYVTCARRVLQDISQNTNSPQNSRESVSNETASDG